MIKQIGIILEIEFGSTSIRKKGLENILIWFFWPGGGGGGGAHLDPCMNLYTPYKWNYNGIWMKSISM